MTTIMLFALLLAGSAHARGYTERLCGFDLNRDGTIAGPNDCSVCNATVDANGDLVAGTVDPEPGDGANETQIFVDCDAATAADGPSCGQPGQKPCATLTYAIGQRMTSGQDDIACFRGTCTDVNSVSIPDGAGPSYTMPAVAPQVRNFELPKNAAMIVGWDSDGDGHFPPVDTDDVAVIDGLPNLYRRTFTGGRYVELAHFTAAGYGREPGPLVPGLSLGFYAPNDDYVYVHDVRLDGINRGRGDIQECLGDSGHGIFSVFGMPGESWWAFENLDVREMGGYLIRGSAGSGTSGFTGFRLWGSDVTYYGNSACSGSQRGPQLVKIWGEVTGVEIGKNKVNGNVLAWSGSKHSGVGITAAQCSRDWDIVDNEFRDLVSSVQVQGSAAGACTTRTVDDVLIADNSMFVINPVAEENGCVGAAGISLSDGDDGTRSGAVTATGNLFRCDHDCAGFVVNSEQLTAIHADTLAVTDSTIILNDMSGGGPSCFPVRGAYVGITATGKVQRDSIDWLRNTVFGDDTGSDVTISLDYAPGDWTADENCYVPPTAGFKWNGTTSSLANWQTLGYEGPNTTDVTPCPEPSTLVAGSAGLALLARLRRRRQR